MNFISDNEIWPRRIARISFAIGGGISLLVLLAWAAGFWRITVWGSESVPMAPSAGILLLGLTVAAWLGQCWPESKAINRFGRAVGLGVLLLSLLTLGKIYFGLPLPLEAWLTRSTDAAGQRIPVGHVSPLSALTLLLNSLAWLLVLAASPARRWWRQVAALLALASLVIGLVVILGNVMQVQLIYNGTASKLMATQTAEVVFFVGLGLLLLAGTDVWPLNFFFAPYQAAQSGRRPVWGFLAIALLLTALIGIMGGFYFKQQQAEARRAAQEELQAIGNFKIRQISDWMNERRGDAETAGNYKQLSGRFLSDPGNLNLRRDLIQLMNAYRSASGYSAVVLFDSRGIARLATPTNADQQVFFSAEYVQATLRSQKVIITDLHRALSDQSIHLNLLIPIRTKSQVDPLTDGVLLFDVDPYRFLYPLVQSWPTASRTAETLLVRREGSEVLFLNDLRHRPKTALQLRLPVNRPNLPAALAVQGKEGVIEGVDYRGVKVLAVTGRIPNSPWFMVAKVDLDEIYAPLRQQARMTGLFFGALILASFLVAGMLWHQQKLLFAQRELVQRQQAESLLRENAEKLNGLFYLSPLGIALCDLQGRYLEFNQAFQDICGYSAEELKHLDYWKLTPKEYAPQEALQLAAMQETGRYGPYEKEYLHKDGRRVPLCLNGMLITGRDGQSYIWSLVEDITERKKAEVALAQERNLLNSLVTNIPDHIYFKDRASKFIKINATQARAFGLRDPAEAVGRSDVEFFPADEAREYYADDQKVMTTGEPLVDKEEKGTWLDGRVTWSSTTKVPLRDKAGEIIGLVGVSRDITAHKLLEEEFRQAQKMQAVGQLAAGVAHDFNNILTVIMGNTSILQDGHLDARKQEEALAQIARSADRAADLTRQLLTFSRRQPMQLKSLDLNEVIINVSKLLRSLIGEHIVLQTQFGGGHAPVQADEGMMEQVLMNLVVNARDAMPSTGGRIIIQTERVSLDQHAVAPKPEARPGEFIRVSVSDNGCGIPPENLQRIFEPFFTTKEVGKGTGLGLATVFGIVQQHQGWVEVESQVGLGTTLHIYLPRNKTSVAVAAPLPATSSESGGTETILLVEDDPALRQIAHDILRQQGYRILEAESGVAALKVWRENRTGIQLLITDVVMPGGTNGRELAQQLQSERPELKVIYISGYNNELLGEGLPLSHNPNFLDKPFSIPALLRKVRSCLDGRV